ncbi:MAG: hypothetical protein JO214_01690 [Frankiaceae bacterium]|nr:hypothetical protein [Frankiaceae bacterium]
MRTRIAQRIAVLAVGTALPVLVGAGTALADLKPDDGQVHGPSLGAGDTLLLFVVIPVGLFLLIAALSVLPSALSRPRYRPGKPWDHDAAWIGDPMESAPAPTGIEPSARGGASAEW